MRIITVIPTHVGICGSDLQKLETGAALQSLGHEIVGIATIGDAECRVAVNPLMSCGDCEPCRSDRSMFCEALSVIGRNIPGALSGSFEVPEHNVVPLPDPLSDETAVLADPYAVVLHGMALMPELVEKERVLIIGDGSVGLLNLIYLLLHGTQQARYTLVTKRERIPHLQAWLEEWADTAIVERVVFVDAVDADDAFDAAIEAVGRDQIDTFALAVRTLKARGLLLHYGVYPPGSRFDVDMRSMMYKELKVIGVNSYNPQDFEQAVAELHQYQDVFTSVVGETFDWSERDDAIRVARGKIKGIAKKVILKVEQA